MASHPNVPESECVRWKPRPDAFGPCITRGATVPLEVFCPPGLVQTSPQHLSVKQLITVPGTQWQMFMALG